MYVDGLRLLLQLLEAGTKFCWRCQKQKELDTQSGESPDARTSRLLRETLNSLESDIEFTTEVCGDFENNMLPTLDYQVGVQNAEAKKETMNTQEDPSSSRNTK